MHESVAWKRLVTASEELTELRDKGHRPDAPHKDPISINSRRVSGREGGESKKSGKQRADDATERSDAHASRHMQTLLTQPTFDMSLQKHLVSIALFSDWYARIRCLETICS